jgi:hypothetical protein
LVGWKVEVSAETMVYSMVVMRAVMLVSLKADTTVERRADY